MYKTNLQELCHQKRWGLPRYSSMKDGPDHIPSFKASVSVNGVNFDSPGPCTSSKRAQNEAAKLAFLHFTSSDPPSPSPATDLDHLYISQLQNYAQRNHFDSPVFTIKSKGPPHALRFKATVLVDQQTFESPAYFSTLEEAKQAAAEGGSGLYKNLLYEFAQKEGFCKPTYKTVTSGTVHVPTFFSIVEVEGKEFQGKAGKSKKQAEQDAAKVAYIALKECEFNKNAAFSYSDSIENEAVESIYNSDNNKSKKNLKQKDPSLSPFAKIEDEAQEQDVDEILPSVKVSYEISNPSFLQPSEEDMKSSICSLSPSEASSESSAKQCPSSPVFSQLDLSALSISKSNNAKTPETSSHLLNNRIRVYTSFPDISFPEEITVLPIRENRWVAMSLEFPNEKVH